MSGAPRFGRGLRVRSAVLFAALAAALLAGVALLGRLTFERIDRAERDAAAARLARVLEAECARHAEALASASARVRDGLARDPAALEALVRGRPAARELAARRAAEAGLDALVLVRPGEAGAPGTVLSAHPWPERMGAPAGPDLPAAAEPAALHRRPPEAGGGLDVRRADLARPGGVPLLVVASSRFAPGALAGLGEADLRLVARVPGGTDPVRVPIPGEAEGPGAPASVAAIRAEIDAGPGATLTAVAARDPAHAAERRRLFRDGLSLAALVAIPLAAFLGWWSAARASAPVEKLVDAVDAIAAGEADYAFARGPGDELDELAAAFSRLQRALEEQRARSAAAERVAAWKEIARRVAHEVKNPLAPIRLTVQNLQRARERAPERFDALLEHGAATILEEVDRLDRLVGEFSSFARLPAPRPVPLDARDVLGEVARLFAAEPDVVLDVRVEGGNGADAADGTDGPLRIAADRDQLVRALANLVKNAIEAMRAADAPAPRRVDLVARRDAAGGGSPSVRLAVRDGGPGFGAEGRARATEPYYTTKESGTGLGLAIARRIAEEHGGTLEVRDLTDEAGRGAGAEVALRWPAAPAPRGAAEARRGDGD